MTVFLCERIFFSFPIFIWKLRVYITKNFLISKIMGFKNYPTPHFEDICISDDPTKSRVINRLIELLLIVFLP